MSKNFFKFWNKRRERFYRRHKWQLVLDFSLIAIVLILIGLFIQLVSFEPLLKSFVKWPISTSTPSINDSKVLSFDLKADSENNIIKDNDDIIWKLSIINDGERNIKKASLNFYLNDNSHSIKLISSEDDSLDIQKNQIFVQDIKAGDKIDFTVKLSWKNDYPGASRLIKTSLKAVVSADDDSQLEKIFNLNEHRVIANLNLTANLYYHSTQGDQLGIGPIPPVVGIPTKYWLIIKADSLGNEIDNFVFSAQLADGVEFADDYSLMAGKFSYDKNRRLLIWAIEDMNLKNKDYVANFAVSFTPHESNLGKNAVILKSLQYHADDSWTGASLSGSLNNLDSSLPADRINKGQGIVVDY